MILVRARRSLDHVYLDPPPQPTQSQTPTASGHSNCWPSCRDGRTEGILHANGFAIADMVELVRARLATATAERVVAGSRKVEVAWVRITDAGRQALAKR
jgi:hypothetical protein